MMIEICAVGGYYEVGRNMTAIKVDEEVIILDMGLHMPNYIAVTEDSEFEKLPVTALKQNDAIPQEDPIKNWRKYVKAIIPSHAHLDHVGAIPFMANKYKCPVIGTPFTIAVLQRLCQDHKINLNNKFISLNPNASYKISENIKIDFINMPHSCPQTVAIAVHTKYGIILYATDWKFDNNPTLGQKPNYEKLKEIGKKGVIACFIDCLYADDERKTPSESVAREMLKDVMLNIDSKNSAMIVTTFASHLARLKSIIEFGAKLNREVIFIGRSLAKYTQAGEDIGIVNFSKDVNILKFTKKARKVINRLEKDGIQHYLLVVTGHQGEKRAVLSRLANQEIPFDFYQDDIVIFSCRVIPDPINMENRKELEKSLKSHGVRIFKDIHVSGHPAREDLRALIKLVNPEKIIPIHGDKPKVQAFCDLVEKMGYQRGKKLILLKNSDFLRLKSANMKSL